LNFGQFENLLAAIYQLACLPNWQLLNESGQGTCILDNDEYGGLLLVFGTLSGKRLNLVLHGFWKKLLAGAF